MKGRLQALSIQTYALFNKKDKIIYEFEVKNPKHRLFIDSLQGKIVTTEELEALLK